MPSLSRIFQFCLNSGLLFSSRSLKCLPILDFLCYLNLCHFWSKVFDSLHAFIFVYGLLINASLDSSVSFWSKWRNNITFHQFWCCVIISLSFLFLWTTVIVVPQKCLSWVQRLPLQRGWVRISLNTTWSDLFIYIVFFSFKSFLSKIVFWNYV